VGLGNSAGKVVKLSVDTKRWREQNATEKEIVRAWNEDRNNRPERSR